jgi:CheY-like chemotaxis protein
MLILWALGDKMERKAKKVLIVDDSGDDILLAKKILEKHGLTVVGAYNWMEALEYLDKGDIDLVLLDLSMPDMNGLDLLAIIRKERNFIELPVVIYTATNNVDANDCAIRGSSAYVKKYGDPNTLVSKIEEMLALLEAA